MAIFYFTGYFHVTIISYMLKNKMDKPTNKNHWIMWKHPSVFLSFECVLKISGAFGKTVMPVGLEESFSLLIFKYLIFKD